MTALASINFPGGDADALYEGLFDQVPGLDPSWKVLPAHDMGPWEFCKALRLAAKCPAHGCSFPVFKELQQRRALVSGLPIGRVLAGHRASVVRSMVFSWLLTAGIVIVILMTPTLAQTAGGIPAAKALHANSWATLGLAVSCILYGLAVDRFGVRRVLIAGAALMFVSALLLFRVMTGAPEHFTAAYVLAGTCVGVVGIVPVLLVRAFPAEIRYSGISFSYNVAYAISGGLTPLIVTLWMRSNPYAPAYYIGVVALVAALTVRPITANEPLMRGG